VRRRRIGAALAVVGALTISACGGSDDGDGDQGADEASSGDGSFAIYDWEPNVVAPPGVPDPTETGVSRAEAEALAAKKQGTIVLLEPAPLDIPETKLDESEGVTRRYFVLRDRPALEQSDVESATIQLDSITDQYSIIVQLTPEGQREYEDLTLKEAKRGESPPTGPIGVSIGPRHAIVVGDEIISIPQLGPGSYATGIQTSVITVVGGFDEERARELADSIDPG
jgi:preprotein translocase subunit SecD